jgi:heme a synthase
MNLFHRLALAAYVCLVVLIFMGAIVRGTGSGLGCPDWPFCFGRMIPPNSAETIDFTQLNLEKFRRKAAQFGRDPSTITPESIRAEFDPMKTWIEYINRTSTVPLGIAVVAMLIASWRTRRSLRIASVAAFVLLVVNAWLGMKVVYSGLKPGVITTHMALAMIMLCVLIAAVRASAVQPLRMAVPKGLRTLGLVLFGLIVVEGVMGSQVRELTDELAKTHLGQLRSAWTTELEQSWVYLAHRSFSWLILIGGVWFYRQAAKSGITRCVLGLILAQMVLGIVLSHIGILAMAQVLHVGLSALLVSALFYWLLGTRRGRDH